MNKRIVLVAGAALLALSSTLIAPQAAHADGCQGLDCPAPVTCTGGSSCVIQLESNVSFFGNNGSGPGNAGVSIDPPPCYWTPYGNGQEGSASIVANYADSRDNYGATLTAVEQAIYNQAYQMQNEVPIPPGEWYMSLATAASDDDTCGKLPPFEWVPAANPGDVPPPPAVPLPPQTLAELALAVMQLPTAGSLLTSPATNDTTYSNMPTFVRVAFAADSTYEMSGGMPYLMVSAQLPDLTGATVWAYATPLSLTSSDSGATPYTSCGYLGSAEMVNEAGVVAATGAGGSADCGFTFHTPGSATITANMNWETCWQDGALTTFTPPPTGADCTPVPNADLAGLQWLETMTIEEIQAGNSRT